MIVLPDVDQLSAFTMGIQETVLVEEPQLKLLGTAAALVILTFITEGRDEALFLLEVAVGLLGIIDGRYEVGPVVGQDGMRELQVRRHLRFRGCSVLSESGR